DSFVAAVEVEGTTVDGETEGIVELVVAGAGELGVAALECQSAKRLGGAGGLVKDDSAGIDRKVEVDIVGAAREGKGAGADLGDAAEGGGDCAHEVDIAGAANGEGVGAQGDVGGDGG